MRKNEYTSLEEFYSEYSCNIKDSGEHYIGIEFKYNNQEYRMCFEPIGKYYLYKITHKKNLTMPDFITIGIFDTIDDLILSRIIEGKLFKEIITDDNTIILSKD